MATYYGGPRTLTYKTTEAGLEAFDGLAGHCKDLVFTPKMGSQGRLLCREATRSYSLSNRIWLLL